MRQIFLDCDGVLADFDTIANDVFGEDSHAAEERLTTPVFWQMLENHGQFFRDLPLHNDALELCEAIAHLHPIILTGCPEGDWSQPQKVEWAAHHFPGVEIITCRSKDKRLHMKEPGDVLVDDFLKYRHLWVEWGGTFVRHTSARHSLEQLAGLGFDVRVKAL